ncbi:MAG: AMP-binding protein [Myxococcota bacterium]
MRALANEPEAHARFHPQGEALVDLDHDLRWTWSDLLDQSRRWTTVLRDQGVGKGDRVAVLAHNHAATFAVLYACAELGAVLFPMNWRLSEAEWRWQLDHAQPRAILADAAHRPQLEGDVLALEVPPAAPPSEGPGGSLDDPFMLLYTSGTSGRPKGAMLSHRQVFVNAVNTVLACGIDRTCSTLTFTPLFHTGGLNCLSTPLLHAGGRIVLAGSVQPARDLRVIADEGITHLMGVPTIYQMMADDPAFDDADLSSVRDALCGGAPLSVDLLQRYLDRGVPLRQGYGLTEVGPNCFSMPHADQPRKLGSVGKPIHHVAMRLVTANGRDAAVDEPGELWLSGPTVFSGYLDAPEATAAAFDGPWFKTGDVLSRDTEGFYTVCGRIKEMFISGGENVYPAEVEAAIYALSGVAQVAVLGVADARWGEVGHAFVEPRPGVTLAGDALASALAQRLARYKVPKHWTIEEALPRTGAGKLDKQALLDRMV